MEVFIIACLRDFDLLALQCKSIEKYLDIENLNIVINEEGKFVDRFYTLYNLKIASIFDGKISVNFVEKSSILKKQYPYEGWITQQLLKLSCLDNKPYVVLDTKNIFVRPVSIKEFVNVNRYLVDHLTDYKKFAEECRRIFQVDYCRCANTPFIINPTVCEKMFDHFGGFDKFVNWFTGHYSPSEFIVYDMAAQHYKFDLDYQWNDFAASWNCFIFNIEDNFREKFDLIARDQSIKIASIHPTVINHPFFKKYKSILINRYL